MGDVDIWRRLYVSHLEARLQLCEIRHVGLNFEIDSLIITPERKAEAILQRDQGLIE